MLTYQNNAEAQWLGGNILLQNSATIINNGKMFVSAPQNNVTCATGPFVTNLGTIYKIGSSSSVILDCQFNNYGIVESQAGSFGVTTGTNWNIFRATTGGTLATVASGDSVFLFDMSSYVEINGTMSIGGNTVFKGIYDATLGKTTVTAGIADFRAEATLVNMGT